MIFNNGSSQTADFTWVNGGYYNANGYVKTIEGAGDIPDAPEKPAETTTWKFYYNDTNWGTSIVYAYTWDAGNSNKTYLGSWPGSKMTYNNEIGMWEISFTTTDSLISPMVIFNNGKGGDGNQTIDLSLVNYSIYKYNKQTGETLGIESLISSECYPVEYFNMQGIRVIKPEKGLYIKKQGSKITKILF